MGKSSQVMSSWLGSLARGGVVQSSVSDEASMGVAAYVVGAEALDGLRAWFADQPAEVVARERRAAVEVCIWMANADRQLDPEESALLSQIIQNSGLDEDTMDELVAEVHDPPSLGDIEERLTQPVLRELMLALAWEMAEADGDVARSEAAFYTGLAKRLEVDEARARELREAITARVSVPPET